MKEQDIDKLFRDAATNHQASPSPQLWDKIAKQLDESSEQEIDVIKINTASRRKSFIWTKYAVAACTLFCVGLFIYLYKQNNNEVPTSAIAHLSTAENIEKNNNVAAEQQQSSEEVATAVQDEVIVTSNLDKMLSTVTAKPHHKTTRQDQQQNLVEQKQIAAVETQATDLESTQQETELIALTPVKLKDTPVIDIPTRYVTDVEPIKPLIEPFEDEEEMMIAGTLRRTTRGVINKIINVVNENTPTQVIKDEEGSFTLDVGNLFAKNRTKKRK